MENFLKSNQEIKMKRNQEKDNVKRKPKKAVLRKKKETTKITAKEIAKDFDQERRRKREKYDHQLSPIDRFPERFDRIFSEEQLTDPRNTSTGQTMGIVKNERYKELLTSERKGLPTTKKG
jgi:hypothetical protein